ncbi:DUF2079 domain-containing protein [Paludisphaera mucosa]|uniref:DUF2079 domain-containing protein n=1 Tax=Paludisphaera mucosa TaxID=3030827 RepID=A0ABT6FAT1_9BACT|nr:DUF2079 domain-containing protein [Paludisphaera mucosa]MDG3004670.1 DUF2079 domain-containing protein [Paludisphaera mucosa]
MRIDERTGAWLIVAALTATLTATTTTQALRRYHDLRTGWSWDLAYFNQSIWTVTKGDGLITVRPIGSVSTEGPSAWKSNHLGPIRLAMVPFHLAFPDPRTLLIFANIVFWWLIPAAYTLARSESGSDRVALSAVALVPLTPLLWPMAWNDFREIQAGIPFALWAFQGVRSRRAGLTAAGVAGMLACRQEFAVVVMSLAFLPPREDEDVAKKARWRLALFDVGLGWVLVYFVYLKLMVGTRAPQAYVDQLLGPKPTLGQALDTMFWVVRDGLGPWALLALVVPGAAVLAAPWVWSLCNGQWAMRMLGQASWHHVRYAAPSVATTLAAGLIGYARLAVLLRGRRGGRAVLVAVWLLAAGYSAFGLREVMKRMDRIPPPVDAADVEPYWAWARQVGPDDAVLASYEFAAPLSSRKSLYSHVLTANEPRGYPRLAPEFRWVFWKVPGLEPKMFVDQGFAVVHRGPSLVVLRRAGTP